MSNSHISFLIADNPRDYDPNINKIEPWLISAAKPRYNIQYKNWKCDQEKLVKDFL